MSRTSMTLGWLGTGRMGTALGSRLIAAGNDLLVWNRTPTKTESLVELGATAVDTMADLAVRADIVFVSVSGPDDLLHVVAGSEGLLSNGSGLPEVIVDCSTVSPEASAAIREKATNEGVGFLAAPLSGNHIAVNQGKAVFVVSGPQPAFELAKPFFNQMAKAVVYVGSTEESRIVKLCYNLYLGIIAQGLAEVVSIAEARGITRDEFLGFFNQTHLATTWLINRTDAIIAEDWTPTFTCELLLKDLALGIAEAHSRGVGVPVSGLVHEIVQAAIGRGFGDKDFLSLIEHQNDNVAPTRNLSSP